MSKKSIAIIGEGITEWFYFDSLRIARHYSFKVAPDFPQHSDIYHMKKLADDYLRRQYDHIICLVDMDRLNTHPTEMECYKKIKAECSKEIMWVETNPCTEFWFLLHFLPGLTTRHYDNQDEAIAELRRFIPGYEKSKHFFAKSDLFNYLCQNGDLERAKANAKRLCILASKDNDDHLAYSQIHMVLELLDSM